MLDSSRDSALFIIFSTISPYVLDTYDDYPHNWVCWKLSAKRQMASLPERWKWQQDNQYINISAVYKYICKIKEENSTYIVWSQGIPSIHLHQRQTRTQLKYTVKYKKSRIQFKFFSVQFTSLIITIKSRCNFF